MRKWMKLTILMIAVLCSGISFVDAKVSWNDLKSADFFEEGKDWIIYSKGDDGIGIMDLEGRDMVKYGSFEEVEERDSFFLTMGPNPFYDEENKKESSPQIYQFYYRGSLLFPTEEYAYLGDYDSGLLVAMKEDKFGYVNAYGNVVIDFLYDYAEAFVGDVAIVGVKKGKDYWYGLINRSGKEVLRPIYDEIMISENGFITISNSGLYGYANKNGKTVVDRKYRYASQFKGDHAIIAKENNGQILYGILNKEGKEVIAPKYNGIFFFDGEYATVLRIKNGDYYCGMVDKQGNLVIDTIYEAIMNRSENFYLVKKDGKYGFLNQSAKEFISPKYEEAKSFRGGFAAVKQGGKWGYIDKTGKKVIDFIYDDAGDFDEEFAIVGKNGKFGLMNRAGKTAVDFIYEELKRKKDGNLIGRVGKKYYLMDAKGKVLYSDCDFIATSNHNIIVKKDNQFQLHTSAVKTTATGIKLSDAKMDLNGKEIDLKAYTIHGTNYVRIRDMAYYLRNTKSRFDFAYNEELKRMEAFRDKPHREKRLAKLPVPSSTLKVPKVKTEIFVDGKPYRLDSYEINGDSFYKIRDLSILFHFDLRWNNKKKMIEIDTE